MKYYLLRLDPIYMSLWQINAIGVSAAHCLAIAEERGYRFFRIEDEAYYNRTKRGIEPR